LVSKWPILPNTPHKTAQAKHNFVLAAIDDRPEMMDSGSNGCQLPVGKQLSTHMGSRTTCVATRHIYSGPMNKMRASPHMPIIKRIRFPNQCRLQQPETHVSSGPCEAIDAATHAHLITLHMAPCFRYQSSGSGFRIGTM
jgi:hypothetical protein